jgi:hypothetical protein
VWKLPLVELMLWKFAEWPEMIARAALNEQLLISFESLDS